MAYDIEQFLYDVKDFLSTNLPTKLSAIDTEKNDGITLTAPGTYFVQYLGNEITNYPVFGFLGVEMFTPNEAIFGASAEKFTAYATVIYSDANNDPNLVKRLFRYQRALKELFETTYSQNVVKLKVSGVAPVPVDLINRGFQDHIIGVQLEVAIP